MPRKTAVTTATVALLALPVLGVAVVDLANPQWDMVGTMASHYVHGRAGWLIPMSLLSIAIASMILTVRTGQLAGSSRAGRLLLGIWSVTTLVAALAPADPPGNWDQPPSLAGAIHGVSGLLAFAVLPIAALLLVARLRPGVTPLATAAWVLVATEIVFWVLWVDVLDGPSLSTAAYPSLVGAAERLMLVAGLAWLATLAVIVHRRTGRDVR